MAFQGASGSQRTRRAEVQSCFSNKAGELRACIPMSQTAMCTDLFVTCHWVALATHVWCAVRFGGDLERYWAVRKRGVAFKCVCTLKGHGQAVVIGSLFMCREAVPGSFLSFISISSLHTSDSTDSSEVICSGNTLPAKTSAASKPQPIRHCRPSVTLKENPKWKMKSF
jgi:hypothetical protein